MHATQANNPSVPLMTGSGTFPPGSREMQEQGFLSAQELLAGSALAHDVTVPDEVLYPGSVGKTGSTGVASGAGGVPGRVRLRPLRIATMALIARAAREDASMVPMLMIKDSLVEPVLQMDQIRQMHAGLVYFLVSRINLISGLDTAGESARQTVDSPLGQTHLLLARHFGWTPQQVAELTPGQVAVYLTGIERLLALDAAKGAGA